MCRAAGAKTLTLQVQQAPPDLGIRVQEVPDNPSLRLVRVDAARLGGRVPAEGRVVRVALLAEVDGRRIPLVLALTIRPR